MIDALIPILKQSGRQRCDRIKQVAVPLLNIAIVMQRQKYCNGSSIVGNIDVRWYGDTNVWWMEDGGKSSCEVPVCSLPFSGGKINEVTGLSRFSNQIFDRNEMCCVLPLVTKSLTLPWTKRQRIFNPYHHLPHHRIMTIM